MQKLYIFGLWNVLVKKEFSVSKRLKYLFNIIDSDFLSKYEKATQLDVFDSLNDLAINFLKCFKIEISNTNLNLVIKTIQSGLNSASLNENNFNKFKTYSKSDKVAILTNTNIFEATVIDKFSLNSYQPTIFLSFEQKILKPSEQSLLNVINNFDIAIQNIILVDDEARVIQSAQKIGISHFIDC